MLWKIAVHLCNSFGRAHSSIFWLCVHGTGHGMLRCTLRCLEPDTMLLYSRCSSFAVAARSVSNRVINRAHFLCSDAPSWKHALLCTDGLYDGYFQKGGGFNASLAPCNSFALFSVSCFHWGFFTIKNFDAEETCYDGLNSTILLGCLTAVGRSHMESLLIGRTHS